MSILTKAITDMLGQVTTARAGVSVVFDGTPVTVTRHVLSYEDMAAGGFDALNEEVMRLVLDKTQLDSVPVPQQQVTVDSIDWTVVRAPVTGNLLDLTLHRYLT